MSKKLTYDFVLASFTEEGYTLLSKEYKNNSAKLDYICPKGHEHSISWSKWNSGNRCYYCNGSIKHDINIVRKSFESAGYILLSKKYVNSSTKLNYMCHEGHKHSISYSKWLLGKRCPYCYGNVKLTLETVKESFENAGYTLLSKKYINSKSKLKYICNNGHIHSIQWNAWIRGIRCPYCSNKIKKTIDDIRNLFEEEGYKLLTTEYINAHCNLDCVCPKGHKFIITWASWQQGHRCSYCVGVVKLSYDFIEKSFDKEGYTLLSKEYINNSTKLEYACTYGHLHSITFGNWGTGVRCPTCSYAIFRSGINHPNWQGGKSLEKYCGAWKDEEYKQDIRDRDSNMCLNPYCNSPDKNDLTIHHIDYDKKNCKPNNLITVCRSCNSKANKNRKWHTSWYRSILKNRYEYSYLCNL